MSNGHNVLPTVTCEWSHDDGNDPKLALTYSLRGVEMVADPNGEWVKVSNYRYQKLHKIDNLQSRVNDANLQQALTGMRVNYYLAQVKQPQREEQKPYQAECEDIIQALGMTFDEGCLFKALWRNASARLDNGKPGQSAVYDAEKMMHYASRIHKRELSK